MEIWDNAITNSDEKTDNYNIVFINVKKFPSGDKVRDKERVRGEEKDERKE